MNSEFTEQTQSFAIRRPVASQRGCWTAGRSLTVRSYFERLQRNPHDTRRRFPSDTP